MACYVRSARCSSRATSSSCATGRARARSSRRRTRPSASSSVPLPRLESRVAVRGAGQGLRALTVPSRGRRRPGGCRLHAVAAAEEEGRARQAARRQPPGARPHLSHARDVPAERGRRGRRAPASRRALLLARRARHRRQEEVRPVAARGDARARKRAARAGRRGRGQGTLAHAVLRPPQEVRAAAARDRCCVAQSASAARPAPVGRGLGFFKVHAADVLPPREHLASLDVFVCRRDLQKACTNVSCTLARRA